MLTTSLIFDFIFIRMNSFLNISEISNAIVSKKELYMKINCTKSETSIPTLYPAEKGLKI